MYNLTQEEIEYLDLCHKRKKKKETYSWVELLNKEIRI